MSHQSRPGKKDYTTLEAHAKLAAELLRRKVTYEDDIFQHLRKKCYKVNLTYFKKIGNMENVETICHYFREIQDDYMCGKGI